MRTPLSDHDGGGIRVRTDQARHHGCVANSEAIDAVDTQLRVNNGPLVQAHLAGSCRVRARIGVSLRKLDHFALGRHDAGRHVRANAERLQRVLTHDLLAQPQTGNPSVQVIWIAVKVEIDARLIARDVGSRPNRSATSRPVGIR